MKLLSVIIPVKDEKGNISPLVRWLKDSLTPVCRWEAIFVDDGSVDGTCDEIAKLTGTDPRFVIVQLKRNYGQSAAIKAGFDHAMGDVIATMDGDLQNDPADIPRMIVQLEDDVDLVLGERVDRKDKFFLRKVPSRCANWLIRRVLKVPFRDFGCTLRVMRRHVADGLHLYGEMHRFINALAIQQGAKAVQIPVRHHARIAGKTKYTLTRTIRVVLDLMTVKFLSSFQSRPMHFFGGIGLVLMLAGMISLVATATMKWSYGQWMTGNPLLLLSVMFELMGIQFVSLGLIGESMARAYYARSGQRPYMLRRVVQQRVDEVATVEMNYRKAG